MMGYSMGGFGGFGWLGWAFQLMVLIAVIYLIVYAVRKFSGHSGRPFNTLNEAQKILAERFARGEITAEEYRNMKDQLK